MRRDAIQFIFANITRGDHLNFWDLAVALEVDFAYLPCANDTYADFLFHSWLLDICSWERVGELVIDFDRIR